MLTPYHSVVDGVLFRRRPSPGSDVDRLGPFLGTLNGVPVKLAIGLHLVSMWAFVK